jgi:hypothetical protein
MPYAPSSNEFFIGAEPRLLSTLVANFAEGSRFPMLRSHRFTAWTRPG